MEAHFFLSGSNLPVSTIPFKGKEGETARRAAVQKLIESIGGKVEAFYFS